MRNNVIEVRGGDSAESVAVAETRDSVADAKRRARYLASREYARFAELSDPLPFVGVYVNDQLEWEV